MDESGLITVREFDCLTPKHKNRVQKNGKVIHGLGRADFESLRRLIVDNAEESDGEVSYLMRLCSPPGVGEAIQVTGNVGVIGFANGKQLEILPKIDAREHGENHEAGNIRIRNIFLNMLRALGPDQTSRTFESTNLGHEDLPLMEVFIRMFLDEATDLLRKGLRSGYVETHAYQQTVRGRIDFSRQAKANPAHAELLHMDYSEFSLDRAENRLVKTCIAHLKRVARDDKNRQVANRLLASFESVPLSKNVNADFASCVKSRGTMHYEKLLAWCSVFLCGDSFTAFHDDTIAQALLFPMDSVFEDYVYQQLVRACKNDDRIERVSAQVDSQYLFNDKRVRLRPDIIAYLKDGSRVILDTKWKIVDGQQVSPADMHQMYAYGKKYAPDSLVGNQRVILLYPWHSGNGINPGRCNKGHYESNDAVCVDTYFVDLEHMDESMSNLVDEISKNDMAVSERKAIANEPSS